MKFLLNLIIQMSHIDRVLGIVLLHATGTTAGFLGSLKDKVCLSYYLLELMNMHDPVLVGRLSSSEYSSCHFYFVWWWGLWLVTVCDWLWFGLTLKPLKLGSVILFLSVGIVDEAGITVAVLLIRSSGTYFQQIVPQIDAHGCKTSRRNKTKSKMYLKFARNYLPACSCMQEL